MTTQTKPEGLINPTQEDVAILASRRFADRAEIEDAGFVPGWHGEPVEVGRWVVVHGHGAWRLAIATKVTPTLVHAVFTTPTNVEQAKRDHAADVQLDTLGQSAAIAAQARKNHAFFTAQVAAGQGRYTTDATWAQYQRIAATPELEYVRAQVDEYQRQRIAIREHAQATHWSAYVTVTKATGRRDGRKTDLYVLPS